jgi:quinohemoprotein amine dehydrogenase
MKIALLIAIPVSVCCLLLAPLRAWSEADAVRTILEDRCSGCHAPRQSDGKFDAIEFQRKTPEGWEMTISRMVLTHRVELQAGEARSLVKYLSDLYGLAPTEVAPFQPILARDHTVTSQDVPEALQAGCVQCHSYARTALQGRTAEQWERLIDAKLALLPNIENETVSAGLLRTFWYDYAKQQAVPYLVQALPFRTDAWTGWQSRPKADYGGEWKVVGHDAGRGGDYVGRLTLTAGEDDRYSGSFGYEFSNGLTLSGRTTAIVYAGFQWRGVAQLGEGEDQTSHREIFFASEDGTRLEGRRLLTAYGDLALTETWYRNLGPSRLLKSIPTALRAGTTPRLKLFGINLPPGLRAEDVSVGAGVSVQSVSQQADDTLVLELRLDPQAEAGWRAVRVRGVDSELRLTVYQTIDYIRLSPEHGFARPGGGRAPKIFQQFEVDGYTNGADGKKGTADDVKLGRVTPVSWKLEEYVKRINDDDIKFVGNLDQAGLFTPALDGPNSERYMLEGNVGDVWVEAWYQPHDAKRPIGARAHLLVMPPRFLFPPIE